MKMNKPNISLYRLFLLFKRDFRESLRSSLVVAAAVLGVVLFLSVVGNFSSSGMDHNQTFLTFLFAGGFVFTAGCFREIHQRDKNTAWILLPASAFEKFLQRLISSTVLWIIFSIAVYTLCSYAAVILNKLLFGINTALFNPFSRQLYSGIPVYIINSSIFFLGAAHFRKMHFFKTIVSVFAILISLVIIAGLSARFVFSREIGEFFQYHLEMNFGSVNMSFADYNTGKTFKVIADVLEILYYALLAPLLWFVSYLKLKEVEVRDGI